MGVRELVDRQKRWVIPAVVVGIAACAVSAWHSFHADDLPGMVERAYFSDDDGQSYFADEVNKGYSFDHGGKEACRVFVYRCGSGKPFVGVLARPAGQAKPAPMAPNLKYKGQGGPPPALEVRKPGQTKWVLTTTNEGLNLLKSLCPDGNPEAVLP